MISWISKPCNLVACFSLWIHQVTQTLVLIIHNILLKFIQWLLIDILGVKWQKWEVSSSLAVAKSVFFFGRHFDKILDKVYQKVASINSGLKDKTSFWFVCYKMIYFAKFVEFCASGKEKKEYTWNISRKMPCGTGILTMDNWLTRTFYQ